MVNLSVSYLDDPFRAQVAPFTPFHLVVEQMRVFFISAVAQTALEGQLLLFHRFVVARRNQNSSETSCAVNFVVLEFFPRFVLAVAVYALDVVLCDVDGVFVARVEDFFTNSTLEAIICAIPPGGNVPVYRLHFAVGNRPPVR